MTPPPDSPAPDAPYDLIAVGLSTVDVLVRLPPNVLKDDKQFVEDLIIQGGAPVGSGCAGVAMMGYRAAHVARLGKNTLSSIFLEQCREFSIRDELLVWDDTSRPAIALVEIDPETCERTVFIQMDHYGYLRPEDIPAAEIARARALLVDSYDLDSTEAALRAAEGTGCQTLLDFESGDRERLIRLLGLGRHALLPLASARDLTGREHPEEVVRALADLTPGEALVTDGLRGSWAADRRNGGTIHQPAFPVRAMDSTGCGDAFHAGYTIGLLEGWPLPLRMEMGSLLAARVATAVGGRTALPSRAEASSLLLDGASSELVEKFRQHFT